MNIKKGDMAARAALAAKSAPTIGDRLRHAQDLVHTHPADETPKAAFTPTGQGLYSATTPETPATNSSGARFEKVSIELIDVNPFNARHIYRPERVSELAASISAHGQEIPGLAAKQGGRYVLAAGHYRLRALKLIGAKTMDLMVYDSLNDRELYSHSYRENAERETQTALDNALSWRSLLDQGVFTSETEIAEATGQSQPNVNKTLAILRLSPQVLEVLKEDPKAFAMSALYELVLYEQAVDTPSALAMAKLVKEGEAGRKEIQEARAKVQSPRERKRKEISRQYKIQRNGQQIGHLKEWDSGKVSFEIILADTIDREALVAELRRRFDLAETPQGSAPVAETRD
ncbi:MAG: ParB/RepB/Spo0J family partition protein [Curvibacter sp.]|nr:MAG: ParB/RepB/Spo0J family partition protein [Curvibacter sp.]